MTVAPLMLNVSPEDSVELEFTTKVRVVSVRVVAPEKVITPLATVEPLPLIAPPFHAVVPVTVTVPLPTIAPDDKFKLVIDRLPAPCTVPPEMVNVPAILDVAAKSRLPPLNIRFA